MRLLALPAYLRKWGLDFVEVDGWRTRGADFPTTPTVVVWHHTGTAQAVSGNYPSLRVVRDGRSDLPGPLCQVGPGRDGRVYIVAAGKANHAGKGSWAGITSSARTIGIEAESPGDGHWTAEQRRVYPILAAALHDMLSSPASLSCGHREWALPAGRKVDPVGIDMSAMRQQVAALLRVGPPTVAAHTDSPPAPIPATDYPSEDDLMTLLEHDGAIPKPHWYTVRQDFTAKVSVTDDATLKTLQACGLYKSVGLSKRQLDGIPTVKA